MDKEQKQILASKWEQSHKIVREIAEIARDNTFLAYGIIRQAETIVDYMAVLNCRKAEEEAKVKNGVQSLV